MKYFNHFYLISIFFFISASAHITILDFKAERDFAAIVALIKSEWSKLFLQPHFDHVIVSGMFLENRPGDPMHRNKFLHSKVAYDGTQFVGFITYFYPDATTGHIELIAIQKDFRGKGISKKLINYVSTQVTRHGAHTIELYVYPSNPHAIEVYTHLGFAVKNRIMGCLLLAKSLENLRLEEEGEHAYA